LGFLVWSQKTKNRELRNSISFMGIQADSISEMSDEEEEFRIHLLPSSVAFDDFQHAHLIPLIDLAALQQLQSSGCTTTAEKVVEQMASACREWGMFQVINHGVSQAVIDRHRASAASVFALSIQEKMKVKRLGDGSFHGYGTGSSGMRSDCTDIWSEAFYVMDSPLPGDSSYYATKIWGPDGNTEFR
jgi:gibberellin 3-beta-dioxygenase